MKILIFLSLAFAYLLPNNNPPWNSFQSEILAIFFAFGLSLLCFKKKSGIYSYDILVYSILIISFLYLFFNISHFSTYFYIAFLYLISSLCAFHFGVENKIDNDCIDYFCVAIIFSSIISLCIQVLQIFGWDGFYFPWVSAYPGDGRAFGNLGQPNQLASLVVTGFLCSLYLNHTGKIRDSLALVLALLFGFSLALAGSKTAIVSLTVAFFYLINLKNKRIILMFCFCIFFYFISHLLLKGETRDYGSVDISTGRFPMWEMLLNAIEVNPFFGYGLGNVTMANFEVVELFPKQWNLLTAHSHNLFIDFLLWFGIPLGLFVSAQLIVIIYKHLFSEMNEKKKIVACIVIPLIIHAMLEFPLHYAYFLIPFGYLIGTCWNGKALTKKLHIFPLFSFLIFFFGVNIFIEYMRLEEKYTEQRFFLNNFSKSKNQEIINPIYLDIPTWNYNFMTKKNLLEEDLDKMENLVKVYPSYRNFYLLCLFFKENNNTKKFNYYFNKAIVLLNSSDADSFKKNFQR